MKKFLSIFFLALLALPLVSLPETAAAQASSASYTELKPAVPIDTDGKIVVTEFFWYGCIHCYHLEPYLEAWAKKLPGDVEFRRVPAIFNERWGLDAAIYYTEQALGLFDKLHRPLFDAIHQDHLNTANEQAFREWLTNHGVDAQKFVDTMRSFGVQSRLKRAVQLTLDYKIEGTPAMAVNGRYTVSAEQGGSQEGMLKNVDAVVDMVRKQQH